jgi:hypothetical protein
MEMIFLNTEIETFTTAEKVVCNPVPYENGYVLPLGWENELQSRGIEFTYVDYVSPIIEDEVL